MGALPVPTLALNSSATPDVGPPPAFLLQFALDPAQEARAVARRIAADGLVRGVALFPDSTWGTARARGVCAASSPRPAASR